MAFLTRKWTRELDYRLIKEVWAFRDNRIAVRFAYEWHDDSGNWFRSYGNENWEFDEHGLMRLRIASINDLPITESDRKYHWPLGRRPDDHPVPERARAMKGIAPRQQPSLQAMYWPPLASRQAPVMNPASSAARKATQRAISSAVPSRPTGISGSTFVSSTSLGMAETISVASNT